MVSVMTSLQSRVKRGLDVVGAAGALLVASPVLVVTAVAVRLTMGRPVLFHQKRTGRGGVAFDLCKFRTMSPERPGAQGVASDYLRITPLGRALRALSIDELPTLVNVLRGEMSLVGPRPLLTSYAPLYSARHFRRHDVRPGVTGWAQINGRNSISWAERFELDVWYVDHATLWLDLKILALTFPRVVQRQGVNHPGAATMPEFTGY